jgi:integrase
MFRWAVGEGLVPAGILPGLGAVEALKRGRCQAHEPHPVGPVPEAVVAATLPHLGSRIVAMVRLQMLTAARPGEVVRLRGADIDRGGPIWVYTPSGHKTEHHARGRRIYIGPKAQEVLRPWLKADPAAFLFSPREAMEEHRAERRRGRKTPLTPSQRARPRKRSPLRAPGERHETRAYCHAIAAGCDKAFPHPTLKEVPKKKRTPEQAAELAEWRSRHRWHPHQLRHLAATLLRREHGLEAAQILLGHAHADVTQVYAERDEAKALSIVARVG